MMYLTILLVFYMYILASFRQTNMKCLPGYNFLVPKCSTSIKSVPVWILFLYEGKALLI